MVQINWTPQALSDLKDIADYIGKDSKYDAKLQVIRIKSRVEILKSQITWVVRFQNLGEPIYVSWFRVTTELFTK